MSSPEPNGTAPKSAGQSARSGSQAPRSSQAANENADSQRTPGLAQSRASPLQRTSLSSNRASLASLPRADLQASARKAVGNSSSLASPSTPRTTNTSNTTGTSNALKRNAAGDGGSSDPSSSSSPGTPDDENGRTPVSRTTTSSPAGVSPVTSSQRPERLGDIGNMIWGTTIKSDEASAIFREFVKNFKAGHEQLAELVQEREAWQAANPTEELPAHLSGDAYADIETEMDGQQPYYLELLRALVHAPSTADTQVLNVGVNVRHLMSFPATVELYEQLVRYPTEIIPLMDMEMNYEYDNIRREEAGEEQNGEDAATFENVRVRVRVFNLAKVTRMRDLNPTEIDTLVSIKGMVIRTNSVVPDMKIGYFRCSVCQYGVDVKVNNGRLSDPAQCDFCRSKRTMELIHNRCVYVDKQLVKVQETPESIPAGETPLTLQMFVYEDMVDAVLPGDRVNITGVFRANGLRVSTRARNLKAVFATYIDAIHVNKHDKDRMSAEGPDMKTKEHVSSFKLATNVETRAAEEKEARVLALSKEESLYVRLANSLAPSVWELEDVKKGILLQLFGGCNKDLGSLGKIRGEMNVLLCGDPGTAKSQLLSYVHRIAPRGMYTSGTGSSAVGLTAYITKDPETKEPVLESGALVLSDRGVCCIDEFDKMTDATRSILHEVMEQQTVSIAKAGIIATLNARTSILASANPKESRYNPAESVVANLQLPPTLLSRFDLIYLILDKVESESDSRLASHLVSLHWPDEDRSVEDEEKTIDRQTFSKQAVMEYISYAKSHVHPRISMEAQEELVRGYTDMRRQGLVGGRKTITATTRQLESLIRMSEAHARMRMSDKVESSDVQEAIRLMKVATQQAAVDPRTGTIDMNLIATGHSASEMSSVNLLADVLRDMFASGTAKNRYSSLADLEKALAASLDSDGSNVALPEHGDLRKALQLLANERDPVIRYNKSAGREEIVLTSGF